MLIKATFRRPLLYSFYFHFIEMLLMNYATESSESCNINLIENEIAAVKTEINNEFNKTASSLLARVKAY